MNLVFQIAAGVILAELVKEIFGMAVSTVETKAKFPHIDQSSPWPFIALGLLASVAIFAVAAIQPF